jgi:hypothetical protein
MSLSCFIDVQLLCIDSTIIDTDNKIYLKGKRNLNYVELFRKFFVKDARNESL